MDKTTHNIYLGDLIARTEVLLGIPSGGFEAWLQDAETKKQRDPSMMLAMTSNKPVVILYEKRVPLRDIILGSGGPEDGMTNGELLNMIRSEEILVPESLKKYKQPPVHPTLEDDTLPVEVEGET